MDPDQYFTRDENRDEVCGDYRIVSAGRAYYVYRGGEFIRQFGLRYDARNFVLDELGLSVEFGAATEVVTAETERN